MYGKTTKFLGALCDFYFVSDFMNIEFLDNFIKQSKTSNLRTKGYYPASIFEMDLKVSFGMGTPTHVPWISALDALRWSDKGIIGSQSSNCR